MPMQRRLALCMTPQYALVAYSVSASLQGSYARAFAAPQQASLVSSYRSFTTRCLRSPSPTKKTKDHPSKTPSQKRALKASKTVGLTSKLDAEQIAPSSSSVKKKANTSRSSATKATKALPTAEKKKDMTRTMSNSGTEDSNVDHKRSALAATDLVQQDNVTSLKGRNHTRRTLVKIAPEKADVFALSHVHVTANTVDQYVDLEGLERVSEMLKVPEIISMDLHTFDTISEDIISSVEARKLMYHFTNREGREMIQRYITTAREEMKGRFLGASLYVRVVHPCDVAPHTARPEQQAGDVKRLRDDIERVLRRYVSRVIEPFPNELAIDLTHYRTFLALLNVSRRNVAQFRKDAQDYMAQRPVNPEGVPGGPPPAEDLEPISADTLAAEIARLLRRDVLLPYCKKTLKKSFSTTNTDNDDKDKAQKCSGEANGSENEDDAAMAAAAATSPSAPRICIGVATSPVMAKVACDGEVAVVLKRLEALQKSRRSGDVKSRSDKGDAAQKQEVPLVSIRSLYRHTLTTPATTELAESLSVSQIPLFTPAFVELLRRVFGIRTCKDLFTQQAVLFFCFSPATATVCLSAAFGRMRFPVEQEITLVAMHNLIMSCGAVRFMASNAMSLVNAQRTAFAASVDNITRDSFVARKHYIPQSMQPYGRLTTDAEIIRGALNSVSAAYTRLYRDGMTFRRIHCALIENTVTVFAFGINVAPNLSRQELLKAVEPQLGPLLERRTRIGTGAHGGYTLVAYFIQQVQLIEMIPPAMAEEAEDLKELVLYTKREIHFCKWVAEERRRARKAIRAQLQADASLSEQATKEGASANATAEDISPPAEANIDGVVLV